MFERFTDRARRVVVLAQEEARQLNHNYIGTEHLLLGLLSEQDGVGAKTLRSMGVSLEAVRAEVAEIIGEGGGSSPSGHIPFTPRAKKVLELSLREALQLGHDYIGTEHILLGLIREGEGVGAQVLTRLGVDLSEVRQRVIAIVPGVESVKTSKRWRDRSPAALVAESRASVEAAGGPVRSHHLLLGLLDDPRSLASKVLASFGIKREAVDERAKEIGVAESSDELPDEAGARRITITVADDKAVIEVDDPDVVLVLRRAVDLLTGSVGNATLRGDAPGADFRLIWNAVRETAADLVIQVGRSAEQGEAEAP